MREINTRTGFISAGKLLDLIERPDQSLSIKTMLNADRLDLGKVNTLWKLCYSSPKSKPVWYTRFPQTGIPGSRRGIWHHGASEHFVTVGGKDIPVPAGSVTYGLARVYMSGDEMYVNLRPLNQKVAPDIQSQTSQAKQAVGSPPLPQSSRAKRTLRL